MDIANLSISFGASGAPQAVTIAEQVYAGMPIGFGAVTQDRWRSNPVTVNGIAFTLFPGLDSDGRADVWIYAAYGEAAAPNTDSTINRQYASVDLQISLNGVAQNLFGAGTTYTYQHQRTTWLRWQSAGLPWSANTAFIQARIADGTFLQHDSRNVFGTTENTSSNALPTSSAYQPFKVFSTIDQNAYIGDSPRGSTSGGERTSIGPVHEWFARLISEVGTNSNTAWLTGTRLQVLKDLAETAAQFPHASGLLEPVTNRLLDPSVKPHCSHGNPNAWFSATGIPQPGGDSADPKRDGSYDNAHPYNKFSFQAYHLSKDPFFLLHVQGQAIACLTYSSLVSNGRGADGKTLRLGFDQERAMWWGLQTLFQAWHATPSGTMPKPFRDKAWFATAIENTLQLIRDKFVSSTTHMEAGIVGEAMRFWRLTAHLGANPSGEYFASHFQEDYGNIVLAQALILGYSAARDVAEWHAVNIQRRLQMGGSWFLNDQQYWTDAGGFSGYGICPSTGSLPYSDVASFKAWYPRKAMYTDGPTVTPAFWPQQYGRDTYLFLGAVNLTKEASRRGLITLGFDPVAAETELRARFIPPYTSPTTGNYLGYEMYAKQYFNYQGVAVAAPPDSYTGPSGKTMYFGQTAPASPPATSYPAFTDTLGTVTQTSGSDDPFGSYYLQPDKIKGGPMVIELHGSGGQNYTTGRQYRAAVSGRMAYDTYTEFSFSASPASVTAAGSVTGGLGYKWYTKLRPMDEYGAFPSNGQKRESFFSGFRHLGTNDMTLITARRLDAMMRWMLSSTDYTTNFDLTRISIAGGSMGADACFTYGIRRPQWFAAVYSDRGRWRYEKGGTNMLVPDWNTLVERLSGAAIPNVAPEDGGGKFADYQDGVAYVANAANPLPWIGWAMGTADPNYPMADHAAAAAALKARKSGFCFVWDDQGHGTLAIQRVYASYPPGTFQIGKSYPYFSEHSLDKDPLVDAIGGINEGLSFRNVVDTAGAWSCEVTNINAACTVKVEPCNPVNFPKGAAAKLVTIPAANTWVAVTF